MSQTLLWSDGDLNLGDAGRGTLISGNDKAAQEVGQSLTTDYDASRGFGQELMELDVPAYAGPLIGRALVSTRVTECLDRLKDLQQKDSTSTPDERLAGIAQLDVIEVDATSYAFFVAVETEAKSIVTWDPILVSLRHTFNKNAQTALNEYADQLGGVVG
mgnify:CR=1 FL=1